MAQRGRTKGFVMSDEHREKLRQSNILTYLIKFFEGERKMSPAQAQVGIALLKKIMPDLSSVEMGGPEGGPIHHEMELTIVDPKDASSEGVPTPGHGEGAV
jgi:hypothetical protein